MKLNIVSLLQAINKFIISVIGLKDDVSVGFLVYGAGYFFYRLLSITDLGLYFNCVHRTEEQERIVF